MFFKKETPLPNRLFKYKAYDNFLLDSLIFNYYWAQPASKMNDIFEGMNLMNIFFKKYEKHNHLPQFKIFKDAFIETEEIILKTNGILCLTSSNNNQLMWAHYGDSYKGLCIEYSPDICNTSKNDILIPIDYVKKLPLIKKGDLKDKNKITRILIGIKSEVWSYEKEYRIIHDMGAKSIIYDCQNIKAIYFGYRFDSNNMNNIFRALKDNHVRFYKMIKSEVDYSFNYEEITDIPSFNTYEWNDIEYGSFEFNYRIDAFNKNRNSSIARVFIYTKNFITEDLAKAFHKHLIKGLCSNISKYNISLFHESEFDKDVPITYFSFINGTFYNNMSLAKEFFEMN